MSDNEKLTLSESCEDDSFNDTDDEIGEEQGIFPLSRLFLTGEVYAALRTLFPDRVDELYKSIETHILERRIPHKCPNCRNMIPWHHNYCDFICEAECVRLNEDPP
jgi:hypothetical protein